MKTDSSDCKKCGGTLYIIEGVRFDRDQMRNARYCAECHTLWACYAEGLCVAKEGVDMSELKQQNIMLRNTLSTVLELCPVTKSKGEPMPRTPEYFKKRALTDQKLILDQRTKIGILKSKIHTMEQKVGALQKQLRELKSKRS